MERQHRIDQRVLRETLPSGRIAWAVSELVGPILAMTVTLATFGTRR